MHPFNSSVWHVGLGWVVVGVCVTVGLGIWAGWGRWVLTGSLVIGGGIVVTTALASGSLGGVLTAVWIVAVGVGVGDWLLRRAGLASSVGFSSRLVLGGALGLGVLALGVLGLGLARGLHRWLVGLLLALVTVAVGPSLRRLVGVARQRWRVVHAECTSGGTGFAGVVAAALGLCLVGAWLWALAPCVWYDELNYQVAAPAVYAREGAIVDRPEEYRFVWAHYVSMLFTLGIVVGGLSSVKVIHFSLGLLAAVGVLVLGRMVAGERVGWVATVLFLALPIVSWELGFALVDLGVTYFFAAALVAALHAVKQADGRWSALTGVLCGLAVGTKLNAGLFVAPLGAMLVGALRARWGWRRALAGCAYLVGGTLLLAAPWWVRDWVWTGNPIFPFFNQFFASPRWSLESGLQLWRVYGYRRGTLGGLLFPWYLLVNTRYFGEGMGPGVAGALAWLGLPWGALARRSPQTRMVWAAWGVILPGALLTMAAVHNLRFLLPLFVLLAVGAAIHLDEVWKWAYARWRRATPAVALVLGMFYLGGSRLAHTALLWLIPERFPFRVALGLEQEEDFLARAVPEYSALRALDAMVEKDAKVLWIWGYARLYSHARLYREPDREALEKTEATAVLRSGLRGPALAEALAQRGFVALIVNRRVVRTSGWKPPVLDETFLERFAELTFADNGVEVYRLSPVPLPARLTSRNLLANPGFEERSEDGSLRAWQAYGNPLVGGDRRARGGEHAVLARPRDGLTQAVAIEAGELYTLGHWTRADVPGQAARLQINWLDEAGHIVGVSIEVVPAASEWRWNTLTATAPAGATTALVYVSVHEDSQVWFDDMCLVKGWLTRGCEGGQ